MATPLGSRAIFPLVRMGCQKSWTRSNYPSFKLLTKLYLSPRQKLKSDDLPQTATPEKKNFYLGQLKHFHFLTLYIHFRLSSTFFTAIKQMRLCLKIKLNILFSIDKLMINTISKGENSSEISFLSPLPNALVKVINMLQSCGNTQLFYPDKSLL